MSLRHPTVCSDLLFAFEMAMVKAASAADGRRFTVVERPEAGICP